MDFKDFFKDVCNIQPMSGSSQTFFPVEFTTEKEDEDINPYHIRDGKWGGMGRQCWYRFDTIGLDKKNVYEMDSTTEKVSEYEEIRDEYWVRVFDYKQEKWREITEEETLLLPKLGPRSIHIPNYCGAPVFSKDKDISIFEGYDYDIRGIFEEIKKEK